MSDSPSDDQLDRMLRGIFAAIDIADNDAGEVWVSTTIQNVSPKQLIERVSDAEKVRALDDRTVMADVRPLGRPDGRGYVTLFCTVPGNYSADAFVSLVKQIASIKEGL